MTNNQRSKGWRLDRGYRLLILPVLIVLIPAFVLPLFVVVTRSFAEPAFGLANYEEIFATPAYLTVVLNTFKTALTVTVLTLLLGYPFAYVLSISKGFRFNCLLAAVLIPFWTSVIIRTYAWMALLPRRGLINELLIATGIISEPLRMLNNAVGVHIGMVQILLPMMIFPLLNTMRQLDMNKVRAAEVLGANPLQVFFYVYLPMSLPGVFAGFILVMISCLGFYVTPAFMGGTRDAMATMLIEQQIRQTLNWPLAAALATLLLALSGILFILYERLTQSKGGR